MSNNNKLQVELSGIEPLTPCLQIKSRVNQSRQLFSTLEGRDPLPSASFQPNWLTKTNKVTPNELPQLSDPIRGSARYLFAVGRRVRNG
jgi:hypothetical protein